MNETLMCCGVKYSTANLKQSFDCFKSNKFFKKYTSDGREIKKERIIVFFCTNCGHYLLKYLWYVKKTGSFFDYAEAKEIRGTAADKIFAERIKDFKLCSFPKQKAIKIDFLKQSKKIPWVYYKTVNSVTQIPRYINESANAGKKVYCPVKVSSL